MPGALPHGGFVIASFRRTANHLFAIPVCGKADRSAIEVEVIPRQGKVFAGAHACCQGDCEQVPILMTGDCPDECSRLFNGEYPRFVDVLVWVDPLSLPGLPG
jgi:hypothetical protein